MRALGTTKVTVLGEVEFVLFVDFLLALWVRTIESTQGAFVDPATYPLLQVRLVAVCTSAPDLALGTLLETVPRKISGLPVFLVAMDTTAPNSLGFGSHIKRPEPNRFAERNMALSLKRPPKRKAFNFLFGESNNLMYHPIKEITEIFFILNIIFFIKLFMFQGHPIIFWNLCYLSETNL